MKFLVVLCLVALSVAEEDSQEQAQSESTPSTKPTLSPQTTQPFSGQFPSSSLNFGNKDTVASVPFTNFGTFPSVQGNSDFFSTAQGSFPQGVTPSQLPSFPQGLPTGALPNFPQGVSTGSLPNFSQGVPTTALPNFPQGLPTGALPNFPQGLPTGALPNFPQGIGNGALPNFPQGIINAGALPNLSAVPRTVLQSTPNTFHVPNTVLSSGTHPVVGGLGSHFTGYTGGVYPSVHGTQGVPVSVGTFNPGTTGNVGLSHLGHYRVLPQEALSGFTSQGLQHQTVPTSGSLPPFTGGIFTPTQGVLKTPVTGTTTGALNLPPITTGSVQSESTGNVFRRA